MPNVFLSFMSAMTKDPNEARTALIHEMKHGQQTVQYPTTWKSLKLFIQNTLMKYTHAAGQYICRLSMRQIKKDLYTVEHKNMCRKTTYNIAYPTNITHTVTI